MPIGSSIWNENSPWLKEFAILTGGILGALILFYVLLGFALELVVVPHIPVGVERSLGELFLGNYAVQESADTKHLQKILDRLVEQLPPQALDFQLHVEENPTVNAMALPGGHIVLYRGLLDRIDSENELAMILGHELGHFAKRHHLRGLGRGLVLLVLSTTMLGDQSGITQFLQNSLAKVESRFSQGLIQGNISHVFYREIYRDPSGLEVLERAGVTPVHYVRWMEDWR